MTNFPDIEYAGSRQTKFVARVAFSYGDRSFEPGDVFDAAALDVPQWRLEGMLRLSQIALPPLKKGI